MESVLQRRQRVLGSATLFYEQPVHIVRGEGVLLFDDKGRQYVDMYNNVPCVGHGNKRVADAMHAQMRTLNVHSRYLHDGVLAYAERLLALHHEGLESVVFACSGTEASEVALMMARAATGGEGIICTDATYHGNSTEVRKMSRVSLTGGPTDPSFRAIPYPQTYRPLIAGVSEAELCDAYLATIDDAIADFAAAGIPFAGMMVCSILANEGLPQIPAEFMRRATEKVNRAGGLMIADEVQAGFCRSGDWWGYETSGFKPDIATMGKPMGNGMPFSGVAASRELVAAFRESTRYFNTFASSPVQAAAGMAVLDVIEQDNLRETSAAVGEQMLQVLKDMQAEHAWMGDVRGTGLFIGVDVVKDAESRQEDAARAVRIVNELKERGFLLSNAGSGRNVLKIRPPLVFKESHAAQFLDAFAATASAQAD